MSVRSRFHNAINARWRQVHPGDVERFGPAASTIGPPED
jgi:hypothetical protein